jgi:CheY-like chemotaxis protein
MSVEADTPGQLKPEQRKRPRRILVVDDETNAREGLRMLLEDEGYLVQTAADGISAFTQLTSFLPDIVLLDVRMPRMNGLALFDAIRNLPGPLPRIIFMSAGTAPQGAPFLPKPVVFEQLLSLL